MEDKGENEIKHIFSKHEKGEELTKKEKKRMGSFLDRTYLDLLKRQNHKLKKLISYQEKDFFDFIDNEKFISKEEKNILKKIFEDIKKLEGLKKAKEITSNLIEHIWIKYFDNRNFKSSPKHKEFEKEIILLQKIYPKIINDKLVRENLIKQQQKWKKEAIKDLRILVTHEILKEFSDNMKPTNKNLSSIRTKIKRAKERGFL